MAMGVCTLQLFDNNKDFLKMICPFCSNTETIKIGVQKKFNIMSSIFLCNDCGVYFCNNLNYLWE